MRACGLLAKVFLVVHVGAGRRRNMPSDLTGVNHVECTIAVHVGNGRVFRRGRIGPLGERYVVPVPGIGAGESDTHVPLGRAGILGVGLMHGDDVLEAVAVEVAHHQAVAAGERDAA